MTYDRKLSSKFMTDLKVGILRPLLDRVKEDHTLMLAIRNNYIDIYYRGGRLYGISQSGDGASYSAAFDQNYNKTSVDLPIRFPFHLNKIEQTKILVDAIPELKYRMDNFFSSNGKSEREFQQLVVRENNFSNDTHYFIVDIEVAGILSGARYDMLAVRWLSHERGQPGTLVPALMEMKYGTNAFDGVAGLEKHLKDAYALKRNEADWDSVLTGLETQLNQLDELELVTINRSKRVKRLEINRDATPELIFLLAGCNPGSKKLARFLATIGTAGDESSRFDLLFFVASFAGYGMYREAMLNLEPFKSQVSKLFQLASQTRKKTGGLGPVESLD